MPSIINATTTNGVTVQADNSGSLQLATNNGTTAVTIDSSQNVGIGTASPTGKLEVTGGQLRVTASSASSMFLVNPSTTYANGVDIQATYNGAGSFGPLKFTTSSTERMRITDIGKVGIGTGTPNCILDLTSSDSGSSYQTLNITNSAATSTSRGTNRIVRISSNSNGGDSTLQFTDNVSNNYFFGGYNGVAYVSSNLNQGVKLSAGATSWASDSDERLKNIKEPITNAVANLSTLRTVYGNYKDDADDVSRLFLIAQDVEKVYPEAIDVGQDEDKTLGLRAVDLIPVLVAAIQELNAKVEAQAVRIAELEGAK